MLAVLGWYFGTLSPGQAEPAPSEGDKLEISLEMLPLISSLCPPSSLQMNPLHTNTQPRVPKLKVKRYDVGVNIIRKVGRCFFLYFFIAVKLYLLVLISRKQMAFIIHYLFYKPGVEMTVLGR